MKRTKFSTRSSAAVLLLLIFLSSLLAAENWYKGNLHAHTFWSDGWQFPEMVAAWYKEKGYHFLALTDHNTTDTGEKWANITTAEKKYGVVDSCQKHFGEVNVVIRKEEGKILAKLKTFEEVKKMVEQPGRFILLQGEELTARYLNMPVHINIINISQTVKPATGPDTAGTLKENIRVSLEAAGKTGLVFLNHPNFHYALTAEDLAETDGCFFELFNAHPASNNPGDARHPGTERMWDIANALRLGRLGRPVLYGLATDDAHYYDEFSPALANPGRAFVMVRARELTVSAIMESLQRGDFYSSTGVMLKEITLEPEKKKLTVEVDGEKDTEYTIAFVGTTMDTSVQAETVIPAEKVPEEEIHRKAPARFTGIYSQQIGKVLFSVKGTRASYTFTGKELYVRAVITSSRFVSWLPPQAGVYQKAWTQPVVPQR